MFNVIAGIKSLFSCFSWHYVSLTQIGTWVTRQNGSGQNGTDKMVRTKWHGQIGRPIILYFV